MIATMRRLDRKPVLWAVLPGLTPYSAAIAAMHAEQARILAGEGREAVWLLESPPGFNPGNDARRDSPPKFAGVPVEAPAGPGRAGDWSYHGPGVRAAIVMLDLRARRKHSAGFVDVMHAWIGDALAELGVAAGRRADLEGAGLWVGERKVAAMGFNLRGWVTGYGFALYRMPMRAHLEAFAPCGIQGKGNTSLAAEGCTAGADQVDAALRSSFHAHFGPTSDAPPPTLAG